MNNKIIKKLEAHQLATMFPPLNEREKRELENSIKKIGLQEDITLFEGKILDGVHREQACITVGVQPRYKNLRDGISPVDFVLAKNVHRRMLTPAQKVELVLNLREKMTMVLNNEKNFIIEKLEKENKNDILIQNALRVHQKKEIEKYANYIGTKAESVRQGIVIKNLAKKDPKVATDWEDALKGKTSIEAVYNKITSKKGNGKNKNKNNKSKLRVDALHDVTEQKRILTDKYSILFQQNQLIQEKYDKMVQSLKKILTDVKTEDIGDIENNYRQLIKKLETLVDEINNRTEQKISFPSPKDLRKAELKIN